MTDSLARAMPETFLRDKTIHELRSIAEGYGIPDVFSKEPNILRQEIELKQKALQPEAKVEVPRPEYDARLMTSRPARVSKVEEAQELLVPYVERGLEFDILPEEQWQMRYKDRTDCGTLRMPLRTLLDCAERLMK